MTHLPFGQTVALWRRARGLTQEHLARRAGLSRPSLSVIERGQREVTLHTIRALAVGLEVRPGVLVDGQPPQAVAEGAMSRQALERIAAAVVSGAPTRTEMERIVAEAMALLTRQRNRARRGRFHPPRRGKRAAEQAWATLAAYPQDVIRTLAQRISDRQARA